MIQHQVERAVSLKNIGTLAVKGSPVFRTLAGIVHQLHRGSQMVGSCVQGRIGAPTGTTGADAVVQAVMIANCTTLPGLFCQLRKAVAGKTGVFLVQLREIQGMIPVATVNHVGLSGHGIFVEVDIPAVPAVRMGPVQEFIGSFRSICHRASRRAQDIIGRIRMEPHHVFPSLLAVDDFGPLRNLGCMQGMAGIVIFCRQRQTLIVPVHQIETTVAAEANHIYPETYAAFPQRRAILILTVPVPLIPKLGDHATMGLDQVTGIVQPASSIFHRKYLPFQTTPFFRTNRRRAS